jgi:protein-S-isoprenylcysteine O-methyltransferase Ste14
MVWPSALFFIFFIRGLWIVWVATWVIASPWSARTIRAVPSASLWRSHAAVVAGAILLFAGTSHWIAAPRLWSAGRGGGVVLAAATLAGLAFTWWGRIHLGRLWSGTIARKEQHRVVDGGPYRVVRHPIYAGLIAAVLSTALAEATPTALAGWAAIAVGLWLKARAEETFLVQEFGEAYRAYRRRVPMLVPFGPRPS